MTLDQRERLQHRIVHACRHLCALVGADPRGTLGITFERELPEPRTKDQHECAADSTGREERRSATEQEQRGADPDEPEADERK